MLAFGLLGDLQAQSKPIPAPAEYGQFESLQAIPGNGGLSPDGRWIAYGVNRSNRNNELRIAKVADGSTTAVPFGTQPVFSADSQWVAYAIGLSESQEDKLRSDKKPIHRKAGILDLARGTKAVVDDIESFAFNATGSYLAMRRYAPEPDKKPGADAAAADSDGPAGSTLIVRQLATGRDTTFGNVAEFAWQDKGRLLAIAIATEDKTGNGVQLFDPESGALRVLDSSSSTYSGLAWRKDGRGSRGAAQQDRRSPRRSNARRARVDASGRRERDAPRLRSNSRLDVSRHAAHRRVSQALVVRRWVGGVSGRREVARSRRTSAAKTADGRSPVTTRSPTTTARQPAERTTRPASMSGTGATST